jgi:hypothetical protein
VAGPQNSYPQNLNKDGRQLAVGHLARVDERDGSPVVLAHPSDSVDVCLLEKL